MLPYYGFPCRSYHFLRDQKFIRNHLSLHDHFAESVSSVDEYHVTESGFGVYCEHDPRSAEIRSHHSLYGDGKCDFVVAESFLGAVVYGTIVEKRCVCRKYRLFDVLRAPYAEERFLLSANEAPGRSSAVALER